jgi:hypothetical protein
MTWKAHTLTAFVFFLLIGSGTALSEFAPFQFLQKPGPYPVGLKVVKQYDPSRKFPATLDRPEAHGGQGSRPLQTLIWYRALQSSSKPMTVEDYVELAHREIHFDSSDRGAQQMAQTILSLDIVKAILVRTLAENGVPKHIVEIKLRAAQTSALTVR